MTEVQGRTGKSDANKFARLRQAAEDLLPLVQADAAEAETLTHQTDRVAAAELRGAALWSMLLPEALGGAELPFVEAMQIVERITWADGSAGWCTMVPNVVGASVGTSLPDEGARTIFGPGPDVIVVGNGVPRGFANPVDGGYLIRGNWSYGSGIYHADWVHSGCFVMDGDKMRLNADGTPEIVLMHHPKGSVRLTGNWDTLGLRATGSYDYTLQEVEIFVPHHMTYKFDGAPKYRGGPQVQRGAGRAHRLGPHVMGTGRGPSRARRNQPVGERAQRRFRTARRQHHVSKNLRRGGGEVPLRPRLRL